MSNSLDITPLAEAVAAILAPRLQSELQRLLEGSLPPAQRLSTDDLAAILKTSPATIRDWGTQGCPHVRVGKGAHRWVLSEVEEWLKEKNNAPDHDPPTRNQANATEG